VTSGAAGAARAGRGACPHFPVDSATSQAQAAEVTVVSRVAVRLRDTAHTALADVIVNSIGHVGVQKVADRETAASAPTTGAANRVRTRRSSSTAPTTGANNDGDTHHEVDGLVPFSDTGSRVEVDLNAHLSLACLDA